MIQTPKLLYIYYERLNIIPQNTKSDEQIIGQRQVSNGFATPLTLPDATVGKVVTVVTTVCMNLVVNFELQSMSTD